MTVRFAVLVASLCVAAAAASIAHARQANAPARTPSVIAQVHELVEAGLLEPALSVLATAPPGTP
jgi:hypothetical protein